MSGTSDLVFVVDDDASVREALSALVRAQGHDVETFASAHDFLLRAEPEAAHCLVLDNEMPGLSGLELQQSLARAQRAIPIIFITGYATVPSSVCAMKAGAMEYLSKPFDDEALLSAIAAALSWQRQVRDERATLRDAESRYAALTARERQVLALVVRGLLNKQIASELGTSEITVKMHRGRMMRKMRVESLPDLVRLSELLRASQRRALPYPDWPRG